MPSSKDKQVIINMASSLAVTIANMAIFFFLVPFMRVKLGEGLLGIWYLIGSLTGYLILIHSTATAALTKYVAEYRAKGDQEQLQCVISTGLWQYVLLALAALAAGVILVLLAGFIKAMHDEGNFSEARLTLALMILNLVINLPFLGVRAVIAGFQRYDFNNMVQFLTAALVAGSFVLVLLRGYGLVALALCTIVVNGVMNVISFLFLHRIQRLRLPWRYCRWNVMKLLFHFGIFSFIGGLANLLFYYTDNVVIGAIISASMVFVYSIAFKLLDHIRLLCEAAIRVLMPVASEISTLEGDARRWKLAELFTRGSRFGAILTLPMIIFLLVFGQDFISLWQANYRFTKETYWVFVILAVPQIFVISQSVGIQMLFGLAAHRFVAYQAMTIALVNLGLSIVLAKYWGVVGVALGTAIPLVLSRPTIQYYFKRTFEISLRRYYWDVWSRMVPLGLIYAGLLIIQKYVLAPDDMLALLTMAAVNGLAFWIASYWALDAYERQVLRQIWHKLSPRR